MATTKTAERPTTQIDILDKAVALAKSEGDKGMTRERIELVKKNIAKDATDDEFLLYIAQAAKRKLDPLAKQIYFIKRNSKDGPVLQISPSIDGLTLIAERSGKFAGFSSPIFEDDLNGVPKKVEMSIFKFSQTGERYPAYSTICYMSEYKPSFTTTMWQKMPHNQLEKCIKAKLLRGAFPEEIGGMYIEEEVPEVQEYEIRTDNDGPDARPEHQINKDIEKIKVTQKTAIKELNEQLHWDENYFHKLTHDKSLLDLTMNEADKLIEYMMKKVEEIGGQTKKTTPEVPPMPGEDNMITIAQMKKYYAGIKEKNITTEELKASKGFNSLKELTKVQAANLIDEVERMEARPKKVEEAVQGEIITPEKVNLDGDSVKLPHVSAEKEKHHTDMNDKEFDDHMESLF